MVTNKLPWVWGSRRAAAVCRASALVAMAVATPLHAQGPDLRLLHHSSGQHLTDSIRLLPHSVSGLRELRFPDRTVFLGPGQTAHLSGATVVLLTHNDRETAVSLFDDTGRPIREARVPRNVTTLAFGESLVSFTPDPHETSLPYTIDVIHAAGSTRLERKERMIAGFTTLERHLIVDSMNAQGGLPLETEVIDGAGRLVWRFTAPGRAFPRVVVRGGAAAAVYASRPDSILRLGGRVEEGPIERELPASVMTGAAYLAGVHRLFVWGPRDAALVDLQDLELIWQIRLAEHGRFLPSGASLVVPVSGTLAMLTRIEIQPGTWQVRAVFLDVDSGAVRSHRELYETDRLPTHVNRFRRGTAERLVLGDRVFEVSEPTEDRP